MKGAFKETINGIEFLLDYGIIPIVGTVIWKDNLYEIKELANYLDKLGINFQRIEPLLLAGNAIRNKDILIGQEEYGIIYKTVSALKLSKMKVLFGEGFPQLYSTSKNNVPEYRDHYCLVGVENLHIENNGEMYPCTGFIDPKFILGNILNDDLLNIWNYSDVLQEFRDLTVDKIEGCSTCKLRNYCGGGCRAIAYSYTKNIKSPFPLCIYREEE